MEGKSRRSYAISVAPMVGRNDTKDAWSCPIGYEKTSRAPSLDVELVRSAQNFLLRAQLRKRQFDYMMEGGIVRYCAATRWHHRSAFELATTSKPIQVARILVPCVCICDMSMPRHVEVHGQIMWPQAHVTPDFGSRRVNYPHS